MLPTCSWLMLNHRVWPATSLQCLYPLLCSAAGPGNHLISWSVPSAVQCGWTLASRSLNRCTICGAVQVDLGLQPHECL